MNQLGISPYTTDKTQITVHEGPDGGLVVKFVGTIDHTNPGEFLDPLLDRVHTQALEHQFRQVEADITELEFLNSNGIKSVIKWVMRHMELNERVRYGLKVTYSRKITWQQTCLKAINHLAKGSVIAEAN